MSTFNKHLDRILMYSLAFLFAVMIADIFLQVIARNILHLALTWTPDIAQLMFSWTVFLGAAAAIRRGAHYHLDLLPRHFKVGNAVLMMTCHLGAVFVVGILLLNGWEFLGLGMTRSPQALPMTEFWFFLPIPLGALIMACFLMELIPNDLGKLRKAMRGE